MSRIKYGLIIFMHLAVLFLKFVSSEELLELSCVDVSQCNQFKRSGVIVKCSENKCRCSRQNCTDPIPCEPMNTIQSNYIGGHCPCAVPHAECDEENHICFCEKSYVASEDRRRCIPEMVKLNNFCEEDVQCYYGGNFAFCDNISWKCSCRPGFVMSNGSCVSLVATHVNCDTNDDCHQQFGNHSACLSNVHRCICSEGYVKASNVMKCLPQAGYKENCFDNQQCQKNLGPAGACIDGKCNCKNNFYLPKKRNYIKEGISPTICTRVIEIGKYCREDMDCYQSELSEEDQTMKCFLGECSCKMGYYSINEMECVKGVNRGGFSSKAVFLLIVFSVISVYLA